MTSEAPETVKTSPPTPYSVSVTEIDGRLFVDCNDLILVVNEIARHGGPITKVPEFLRSLDPRTPQNIFDLDTP